MRFAINLLSVWCLRELNQCEIDYCDYDPLRIRRGRVRRRVRELPARGLHECIRSTNFSLQNSMLKSSWQVSSWILWNWSSVKEKMKGLWEKSNHGWMYKVVEVAREWRLKKEPRGGTKPPLTHIVWVNQGGQAYKEKGLEPLSRSWRLLGTGDLGLGTRLWTCREDLILGTCDLRLWKVTKTMVAPCSLWSWG
jgi:hypothetical protein